MMKGYKAVLFAPDGDYVTDFSSKTKEEVIEKLSNKGSRWFFYPFEGVVIDRGSNIANQRLVDAAFPIEFLNGKAIKTVRKIIAGKDWEGYFME